jgi:hypothetical protein
LQPFFFVLIEAFLIVYTCINAAFALVNPNATKITFFLSALFYLKRKKLLAQIPYKVVVLQPWTAVQIKESTFFISLPRKRYPEELFWLRIIVLPLQFYLVVVVDFVIMDDTNLTVLDGLDYQEEGNSSDWTFEVTFEFIVHGILINSVGVLGLLGNIFSIVVLSRPQMKSSINTLLIGLVRKKISVDSW